MESAIRAEGRPRSKSTFSFRSSKSDKSDQKHKVKLDLHETEAEKRWSKFDENTKRNPNAAINEAQPGTLAAFEKTTLAEIRSIQHRDNFGNVILDADISNPTRPRLERPLDTIRSFEAAIDNSYRRRSGNVPSTEPANVNDGGSSRRSSYYGGNENRYNSRSPYYGARPTRPDSGADYYGSGPNTPTRNRGYGSRVHSDPMLSKMNGQGVYPAHVYHQSHDTVATGGSNGSHATEPWGNSTDPSSENSSIDKVAALNKADQIDGYANGGHGGQQQFRGPIMEEYGGDGGGAYPQPGYRPPRVRHEHAGYGEGGYPSSPHASSPISPPQRTVIKLGAGKGYDGVAPMTNGNSPSQRTSMARAPSEKRKSWFKRRFSKD